MGNNRTTRRAPEASTTLTSHLAAALLEAQATTGDLDAAGELIDRTLATLVEEAAPVDELAALLAAADAVVTATSDRGGALKADLAVALSRFRRAQAGDRR